MGIRRSSLRRWSVASIAALLSLAALASGAGAARRWHRIASGGMYISDQVGLGRTLGVLHVVWRRRDSSGEDLIQTPVGRSGEIGPAVTVLRGWSAVGNPALVVTLTGRLAAFFPGARTLTTGDPTEGLNLATSDAFGASWSVGAAAVARNDFAGERTPAAAVSFQGDGSTNGPYLEAWYGVDQSVVHPGLDPTVPDVFGYGPGTGQALVAFSLGRAELGWCQDRAIPARGRAGVYVAEVDAATGGLAGPYLNPAFAGAPPIVHLPDTNCPPGDTRVALATFGVQTEYVAVAASSTNERHVKVYFIRDGATITKTTTVAGGSSFKQEIALAANPSSRSFWVGWQDSDSGDIVLRRFRVGGSWGAKVTVPLPAGERLFQLNLDAQRDRVDLVARTSDANNVVHLLAAQAFPGLTLDGTRGNRILRVLEAGKPVGGATVRVAGRQASSDKTGRVELHPSLPAGTYRATAAKMGYVKAVLRFRIRRP